MCLSVEPTWQHLFRTMVDPRCVRDEEDEPYRYIHGCARYGVPVPEVFLVGVCTERTEVYVTVLTELYRSYRNLPFLPNFTFLTELYRSYRTLPFLPNFTLVTELYPSYRTLPKPSVRHNIYRTDTHGILRYGLNTLPSTLEWLCLIGLALGLD